MSNGTPTRPAIQFGIHGGVPRHLRARRGTNAADERQAAVYERESLAAVFDARLCGALESSHHGPAVFRRARRVFASPLHGPLSRTSTVLAAVDLVCSADCNSLVDCTEPMRVETLPKRIELSPLALHLNLKAVTGLSPLHYQKQLRLQEAGV